MFTNSYRATQKRLAKEAARLSALADRHEADYTALSLQIEALNTRRIAALMASNATAELLARLNGLIALSNDLESSS
jgi:hypothetical protein